MKTTLYTRRCSAPPIEVIRAGYHLPSPLYLARISSPALKLDAGPGLNLEEEGPGGGLDEDEAAAAASIWDRASSVREMSSLSSERRDVSSSFEGSETRASSTWESWT